MDSYILQVNRDDIETYERQNLIITGDMTVDVTVMRTATDTDGNTYQTVKIGNQWWLSENLRVTHYRNGDSIPRRTSYPDWGNLSTDAYCDYANYDGNGLIYGHLYNWHALTDQRGLSPAGWHIPDSVDWQNLIDFLGGENNAGPKMKESGTSHWNYTYEAVTNESGFSALPGGYRDWWGHFKDMGDGAHFWSSSLFNNEFPYELKILKGEWNLSILSTDKKFGHSVRCIID